MDKHFTAQNAPRTALLVGTDGVLLYTRKAILEKQGFDVAIHSPSEAIDTVATLVCNVIVACHTLDLKEADALVQAARSNPASPALISFSKHLSPVATAHPFDGSVWSLAPTEAFVDKVHEVLRSHPR